MRAVAVYDGSQWLARFHGRRWRLRSRFARGTRLALAFAWLTRLTWLARFTLLTCFARRTLPLVARLTTLAVTTRRSRGRRRRAAIRWLGFALALALTFARSLRTRLVTSFATGFALAITIGAALAIFVAARIALTSGVAALAILVAIAIVALLAIVAASISAFARRVAARGRSGDARASFGTSRALW